MSHTPWIIVIAPDERTGRQTALETAFDRGLNARSVCVVTPFSGLRKLEGSRPDEIHIVDYLRWGRGTSEVWDWVLRTMLKRPETKRVWR